MKTVAPGVRLYIVVEATNVGKAPISGLRCILEPNKYLEAGGTSHGGFVPVPGAEKVSAFLAKVYDGKLKQWETTGLPLCRPGKEGSYTAETTVDPRGAPGSDPEATTVAAGTERVPYTKAEVDAIAKAFFQAGAILAQTPGDRGVGGFSLRLSFSAPIGSDLPVRLFLVSEGRKFPLEPITLRVKAPGSSRGG